MLLLLTGLICPKISNDPKYLNCNGPHWATDKSCHKYADKKEIRKIAAYKKIEIKSAAYLHNREKSSPGGIPNLLHRPSPHQNPTPNLATPHFDFSNFPTLGDVNLDLINQNQNFADRQYSSLTFTCVNPALLVMEFFYKMHPLAPHLDLLLLLPKIGNKPRDYANSPPWWNEECTKLERLRRAKLDRYRHKCNYTRDSL